MIVDDNDALRPFVPVLEKTLVLAITGKDGKLARETHTIREHEGDALNPMPGGFTIVRPSKDVVQDGVSYRLPSETITVNAAHIVQIENKYRLERRVRLSAKEILAQADTTKELVDKIKRG